MDIEAGITLPKKGYFIKTTAGFRLCYCINKQFKYIYLHAGEETAAFFHKYGIIDSYAILNNQVKMYIKTFITTAGTKGEPVQMTRFVPVMPDDISITEGQAISIAAMHEYEMKGKVMGIVINMINNNNLKRA
jgi:hypothetical protein